MCNLLTLQVGLGFRGFLFGDVDEDSSHLVGRAIITGLQTGLNPDPTHLIVWQDHANVLGGGLVRI
jgi:hypothetical protein